MSGFFTLSAIDGANPLGFLAALGTLRLATLRWPEADVALSWKRSCNWTPALSGAPISDPPALCAALLEARSAPVEKFSMLGKNLTVAPDAYRSFAAFARETASLSDRRLADFAAAFGCEDCLDDKEERIRYTQLCFITGSGCQDFLGTIAALNAEVTVDHLSEALFDGWLTNNKGLAFRWDPSDAREYALRWGDPSKEGAWTTWGANRLAYEALPFFPTQPQAGELVTTGFPRRRRKQKEEFTWPLWEHPLGCDEIKSLLALSELQSEVFDRSALEPRGITEIFRSTRVRVGQGANFKVSFRPARAM
jgi:hypothetical protein